MLLSRVTFFPSPENIPKDLLHEVAVLADEYHQDPTLALSIINCESGFDANSINHNKNGSVDYSYWQINDTHSKEAKLRGFDIKNPNQNLEYGFLMLMEDGTYPWRYSEKCWNKISIE